MCGAKTSLQKASTSCALITRYETQAEGISHTPPSWLKKDYTLGYMTAIMQYTQRTLTNESDTVDAISALINVMAKRFTLGGDQGIPWKAFRHGIAMVDLDQALLWQPTSKALLRRRRIPVGSMGRVVCVQYHDITSGRDVPGPTILGLYVSAADWPRSTYGPSTVLLHTRRKKESLHGTRFQLEMLILRKAQQFDEVLIFRPTTANFRFRSDSIPVEGTEDNRDTQYTMFDILAPATPRPIRVGGIHLPLLMEPSSPFTITRSFSHKRIIRLIRHRLLREPVLCMLSICDGGAASGCEQHIRAPRSWLCF